MDFVREWCFCKLLTGLKDFRLLCPRFIPHVLPSALAGVIFHPAAAALVATVNIFRNMGVVVCPGQSATPLTAAAFGNADDARPQTGPALKIHICLQDIVHGHAGPGTVYHLTENQLVDNEKQRLSIHDIDLLDSLRMAEMLHGSRPNLTVMGMEPADYTSWSMELSPVVQERFPAYLDEVRKEILRLSRQYAGNDPDSTC